MAEMLMKLFILLINIFEIFCKESVLNNYFNVSLQDIRHDQEYFFILNDSFKSNLKYGSKYLPKHLYDFGDVLYQRSLDLNDSNKVITSPNQVLPAGFQNPVFAPFYDPLTFASFAVQMKECLTQTSGFTDPDIGTFNLDPEIYCRPQTLRFITKVTCCAPSTPEQIQIRLLLFPAARGAPGQPISDYNLAGIARANTFGSNNYGPQNIPVTELNWRAKRRPQLIPPSGKIVYLIHGYGENITDSPWVQPVARAWNERGATVIAVDWKFDRGYIFQSSADMRTLGAVVAHSILQWKITRRTLVVGHSLGAQAVSEAGNYAKRKGILLPECTGLDPAGPTFDGGPPETRLTKDDCKLVTIIHSGSEFTAFQTGILPLRLGTVYKSGHCDYWINCGHFQGPRCTDPRFGDFIRREIAAAVQQQTTCAHVRSTLIYLSQLRRDCNFRGKFCTNCGTETNDVNFHLNQCITTKGSVSSLPPFSDCKRDMNVNFNVITTDRYPFC